MGKELFKNVGKELKNYATSLFYWILIPYILFGIGIAVGGGILLADGTDFGAVGFLFGPGLIVFGYIKAKLAVMEKYAYGEIADRLISIDEKLSSGRKASKSDGIPVKVEKKQEEPIPRRTAPWECPFCGSENAKDSRYCKSCGTEDIGM